MESPKRGSGRLPNSTSSHEYYLKSNQTSKAIVNQLSVTIHDLR